MERLIDKFGRRIDYLRISVTDRCNLRCIYCMPTDGIVHKPHDRILSFEEIHKIVKAAAGLGIDKIRITGGEPLVRKDLPLLIEALKNINGLKEIVLTTNGAYLAGCALSLKRCGVDRINISMDSLVPEKFRQITRGGDLRTVLEGINSALTNGFASVKINVVLMKGFNTDEIPDFLNLARARPIHVRFIEYMPTYVSYFTHDDLFFSASDAKDICGELGRLEPLDTFSCSTARVFGIKGFYGTVGFISPISDPFCSSCNKLRLTSDGQLRSCLHSCQEVDLKEALENKASEEELAALFKEAVAMKPVAHNLLNEPAGHVAENFSMCQIGG